MTYSRRIRLSPMWVAIALALAIVLLAFAVVPAFADQLGPCNEGSGEGNSNYAKHHIVVHAKNGALGNEGHKPGSHQGFSLCLGVHD